MSPTLFSIVFTLFTWVCLFTTPSYAQEPVQEPVHSYLQKNGVGEIRFYDPEGIREFYAQRNHEPVWLKGDGFHKKAKKILSVFENSWTHGLNPEHYALEELQAAVSGGTVSHPLSYYEILMSAAIARYGRDISSMRIPPSEIEQKAKFWQRPLSSYSVLTFVSQDRAPDKAMHSLAPQGYLYKELQKELKLLLEKLQEGDKSESVLPLPTMKGSLRVGDHHPLIEDIRYRLQAPAVQAGQDPTLYNDELSQYVMRAQLHHGLKVDGIIGAKTIEALNKTLKNKLEQVIVNLERLRWITPEMPPKYLIVNIPAQTLWALENGSVIHEMPVVIGRKKRQTNSFVTSVTGVRFNPTWTVPKTIKFEDYLPKLKEDPNYLNNKGVEFYWGTGSDALTLPPDSIQWAHLSPQDIKEIRMVQGSGSNNPLGRIRLHMPNQYNIYLHDTNNRTLFDRDNRALSSGCVRMESPEKIAQFVLSGKKNWSEDQLQTLLDKGKMRDVMLEKTLPVYLLYQTIWADDNGDLVYARDVYGRDTLLMKVLKKYNGVFLY